MINNDEAFSVEKADKHPKCPIESGVSGTHECVWMETWVNKAAAAAAAATHA